VKRLLNTLYVTTQGAYLAREGDNILVRVEQETRLRVPIHTLGNVICFGQVGASPPLMDLCATNHVGLAFMTEHGRFMARVQGPVSGNVLLRREQYRRADDPDACATIARNMVIGKIINSRTVLQRALRDHGGRDSDNELLRAVTMLSRIAESVDGACLDETRGREGEAATCYFSVFNHLITVGNPAFHFKTRSRRPPLDPVNALLSFVYTLLAHDVASALEGVGLDPAVGFLHRDRPGRPGLALDLMEEFRPCIADRLVLSLINRQQVHENGFTVTESGGVFMDDATRKEVLVAYQKRKQEEILHPFINEKVSVGLLPHIQALLLARHLRGDLDEYPPFLWK
jgi:CRISPR-associated protein Cas1